MHSLEFVRKNENKTKFNQRDQYKNYSTVFFLMGCYWLSSLNEELLLPDKFREMTKHSNPALWTPV